MLWPEIMLSWESVEKTYTDAIHAVFPLHRVIIFLFGILISISIKNQTHLSISESIFNINISKLYSISELIKEIILMDLFFGLFLVFSGWIFTRLILRIFLYLAARSTDLWKKINSNQPQFNFSKTISISERKEAVEWIDFITSDSKNKMKNINFNSEILAGISIGLIIASYWGNKIDFLAFLVMISASIFLCLKSISIFISDYLGPQSVKSILQTGQINKDNDAI